MTATIVTNYSELSATMREFITGAEEDEYGITNVARHRALTASALEHRGILTWLPSVARYQFTAAGRRAQIALLMAGNPNAARQTRRRNREREWAISEIELGHRAASWIRKVDLDPDTVTTIGVRICRANGIKPNRPHAKLIRATLKAAGINPKAIDRVTTGRKVCRVALSYDHWNDDVLTERVMTALRPLWNDGEHRVQSYTTGRIRIDVASWHNTWPEGS